MVTFAAAVDGEDVDDFLDQQPYQGDDDFMSEDEDFLHQRPGQGEEEEEDDDDDYYSMSDDDEAEEYPFLPVHAPPAAAPEAAIAAALEAAEAPADDCCPVCLQDGREAPEPSAAARPWSRVAPCGHRFHAACANRWLRVKLTCPVCRCSAAAVPPAHLAAARRRDDAAPEPPRPLPDIVEEFLAMGYEECLVFEKSPRWVEFMNDPYRHITWYSSSRVS